MEENKSKTEKSPVALREEAILKFWQDNKIFEKSVAKDAPAGEYVFYDGPPFATGLPHYGHILGSAIKDAVPRYQTMKGKRVERRWGWDCHGLPIENIVEKELKISGKKQIEEMGVEAFNEHARSKVLEYVHGWKKTVDRIGRWVDFDGSYKTMDNTFMESCWWALAEMQKKGLLYEGTRVLPYCPRCETPIANAEIAMDNSYKDIADISIYIKFKLRPDQKFGEQQEFVTGQSAYVLAWTTTPWTLPGNTALAVKPDVSYSAVRIDDVKELLILATDLVEKVLKGHKVELVHTFLGSGLLGLRYDPLFDYYTKQNLPQTENGWKIYGAEFVTTVDGTGVVHIASGFGEDDHALGKAKNLPFIQHVTATGVFKDDFAPESGITFAGIPVKPKTDNEKERFQADIAVIKYLQDRGFFFAKEKITHSYPHCFRCETPLYYFAIPAWFIKIQDLKPRLLELNNKINWIPDHLQHGRFEKSMEAAPDWNISRNRFWATPLPIWKCEACQATKFVSSVDELKRNSSIALKEYILMRHGEAEHNVKRIVSCAVANEHHLTEAGQRKVQETAQSLKAQEVDIIVASDFVRTKETAVLVAKVLGLDSGAIVYDERLREVNFGDFNGKSFDEYHNHLATLAEPFTTSLGGGESYADVRNRVGDFLYDIHKQFGDKKILIITHESIVWLLHAIAHGMTIPEALNEKGYLRNDFLLPGDVATVNFAPLPHNARYELDLHRPYIDSIELHCGCGGSMKRIPEVVDCWFESGSMPFASEHYPFENSAKFQERFPGQFVAEYIAQTRTWFYYMHVASTILFDNIPFENVVTTGTVLAEDGQKMSKSKGNFPDPWLLFDKYGVDALRFYLLSSPLMKSEDLNFSEKGVAEMFRKIIMRLDNTYAFYQMYTQGSIPAVTTNPTLSALDEWIIARLKETGRAVEESMDAYELDRALRVIDEFIDDLSNWYVRRSRDRFKSEDTADREAAMITLRDTLLELTKIIAPFVPFIAEDLYQKLQGVVESVHLEKWPAFEPLTTEQSALIQHMAIVRSLVSVALEARASAGIKVRQPLASLRIKASLNDRFFSLIAEEINVKVVISDPTLDADINLDTVITPELRAEGVVRELIRHIQDERKKSGLNPKDEIVLELASDSMGEKLVKTYEAEIKRSVGASTVTFAADLATEKITIEDMKFAFVLRT